MPHKVSILHPYIGGRHDEINSGLYPKHHLWGTKAISKHSSRESFVRPCSILGNFPEKLINRFVFGHHSPGLAFEIPTLITSHSNDLIYSVCGPLSLTQFYRRSKIVSWVFRPPSQKVKVPLHPYHKFNLTRNAGFLCLTPKAQQYFSQFAPSKFIPWCVDMEMFDGKPPKKKAVKPFFLAAGKTGRDYKTFLEGCVGVNAEIRIIGPSEFKPLHCPPNVKWMDSSQDPPDQAIDYPTLKDWYAQCSAVCIPLTGDIEDTCGYTNMLEAMAMRKPVLMTRSGSLQIDPESGGFGKLIEAEDSKGWTSAMNLLLQNKELARSYGEAGRQLAKKEFTIERFDRDVSHFIKKVLKDT